MKALIIVDVQNDFLPGGKLPVPEGHNIIPVINEIQRKFDLIVATQDWHPQDHVSFASNHVDKEPFTKIKINGKFQDLWPDHCVKGTKGAKLNYTLHSNKIEAIFRKGVNTNVDSYSGFRDNLIHKETGLYGYLNSRGITEVYVCGLAAEYCVYFTANDAIRDSFVTTIIEDATQPISWEDFIIVKKQFIEDGGKVITSDEIL